MIKKKSEINERNENLLLEWKELSKKQAIAYAVLQYRKSQELINQKFEKEEQSIICGIKSINKKVIEHINKYEEIKKELEEIKKRYIQNLADLAEFYDTQIVGSYIKILEEELKQKERYEKIYFLKQEETKAKKKVDNSDDEVREEICLIEDEINKGEAKVRRNRTLNKKKIQEKEVAILEAMEKSGTMVKKPDISGPKIFDKASKFFWGKINPTKIIKNNLLKDINMRLDEFDNQKDCIVIKSINQKYKKENIFATIEKITNEE